MATVILAAGTTEATSADIVLTEGQSATLFLTGAAGLNAPDSASVELQFKRADNSYVTVYRMGALGNSATAKVDGPVTLKVSRSLGTIAVGVERA